MGGCFFENGERMLNVISLQLQNALKWLESHSSDRDRENLTRFAIHAKKFHGVSLTNIKVLAKQLGRSHELAAALWETGWYEARLLAAFVDDPALVTSKQMDTWVKDFDNWGICDTVCFHLFDRTDFAFQKVKKWSTRKEEYVKRAAFALLASLALHDKAAENDAFSECFPLIEKAATDERNFVKKGVSWALRAVGERNLLLNREAAAVAEQLAISSDPTSRWIGKTVLREFAKPAVVKRLATNQRAGKQQNGSQPRN
jgi:3-methyladenine DNA glycosylase AlkD